MTTMEAFAAGVRSVRQEARSRRRERSRPRTRVVAAAAEHGLSVAGMACFVAAAVLVALPLGLAVAGAAFLVLEWRVGE